MNGSTLLLAGFPALSLAMLLLLGHFVAAGSDRRTGLGFLAGAVGWALATLGLAATGVLVHFELPPRMLVVFVLGLSLCVALFRSRAGRALTTLPLSWLVGAQGFRVLVELLIHRAVVEGVAPPQMTWSGWNLDVVSGVTAPLVAIALGRGVAVRLLAWAWNVMALGLLLVVVVVAIVSMPTPLQQMHPDNTWVVHAPYVLLPSVLVTSAVVLHVAALRKLRAPAA
jgi:hypothetical protein